MQRRTFLVGGLVALSGCASIDGDGADTPGDDAPPVQGGEAEYPHAIRVDNALDRRVPVAIEVERGGTTLYDRTHRVGPETRTVVAGFTVESFPPERRYVTVTASTPAGGATSAGVSVTGCLGDVLVSVAAGGGPSVAASTCLDDEVRGPAA